MSWAEFVLPTITMLLLSVVPGFLMLAAVGLRGLVAVGGGAALTIAAAGGLGIIYGALGVPYTLATLLLGLALCVAAAGGIGHALGTAPWVRDERARPIVQPVPLGRTLTAVLVSLVVVGTIVHSIGLARGMVAPGQPVQTWDGVFHLGAIRTVQDTANASSFSGLAPMYDALEAVFYPAVWHGMVAVSPGFDSVASAANASSFVMGPIWFVSGAALARTVWPERPLAAVAAPLVAASFVTTPTVLLGVVSLWPYAAAHVAMPGLLALIALAIRQLPHARPTTALAVPSLVGFLGAGLTHGSAAFTMILLAGPLVAVGIYRASRHAWLAGHRRPVYVTLGVLVALLALVVAALAVFPVLDMVLNFERGGQDSYYPVIGQLLIDNPMVYSYDWRQYVGQVVVTVLAIVGAAEAMRQRSGRWLVLAWICALALTVLTAGPEDNPLRAVAGFWYTQPSRVVVLVGITAVPLAARGVAVLAEAVAAAIDDLRRASGRKGVTGPRGEASSGEAASGVASSGEAASGVASSGEAASGVASYGPASVAEERRRLPIVHNNTGRGNASRLSLGVLVALLGGIVVLTGGLRVDQRTEIITNSYVPGRIAWGTMLSEEEIDLVTRAGEVLPDDAVVVGDPFAGAAYLYSLGGVDVLYRQLGQWDSEALTTLGTSFDEIYTNPEICEIVRDLGVTHVYTDTHERGPQEHEQKYSYRSEGFAYVQPGEGFELVDQAGTASIWRLTYCDDVGASADQG